MAKLTLTREQIREIVFVDADNKYKNGARKDAGKTFSRYQYFPADAEKAMVFTVETTNPFNTLFGSGKIESVILNTTTATKKVKVVNDEGVETEEEITTPALEFVNCISSDLVDNEEKIDFARESRRVAHQVRMKALLANADKAEIDQETLNAILSANI